MLNNPPKKHLNIAVFVVILLVFLLKALPGVFNENVYVYSPAEIHNFDSSLYPNNIDVLLNDGSISPRFVAIGFIKVLMSLGSSYEGAYLLVYILTSLITACAVYLFLKRIESVNNLYMAVLASVLLAFSSIGDFARFQTFTPESLFLGLGLAFATVGVVFALFADSKKDITLAYLFVILAGCAHIHEGIWGFAIVSLLLLFTKGFDLFKSPGGYLAAGGILLLTVPVLMTTEQAGLPAQEFYDIYVRFRAPHHLCFEASSYMIPATLLSYILIALIVREKEDQKRKDYKLCVFLAGVFLLTLVVWFVGCEKLHISFFIKLYIPKFIKYLNIVFTLILCKSVLSWKGNTKYLYLFLIVSSVALNSFIIPLYLLPALLVYFVLIKMDLSEKANNIILAVLAVLFLSSGIMRFSVVTIGIIFVGMLIVRFLDRRPIVLASYLALVLAVLVANPLMSNKDLGLSDALLANQAGRDIYDFSRSLSEIVPKDEVVLADSRSKHSGYIQQISRRDIYALFKAAPSNENGIGEWYERLQDVKDIGQWDANQFSSFMQRNNMNFVVINKGQYNESFDDMFEKEITSDELILLKRK